MFLISFLGVILILGLNMMFSGLHITYLFDAPSLLILILIIIPTLIQTGLLKDFNNSFRLTMGKKSVASFKEIKRAIEALKLVRTVSMYTAIFTFCISVVIIIIQIDKINEPKIFLLNISVAMIILIYATLLNIIFLPMEKQLEVRLIEFDAEAERLYKEKTLEETSVLKQLEIEENVEWSKKKEKEQHNMREW